MFPKKECSSCVVLDVVAGQQYSYCAASGAGITLMVHYSDKLGDYTSYTVNPAYPNHNLPDDIRHAYKLWAQTHLNASEVR